MEKLTLIRRMDTGKSTMGVLVGLPKILYTLELPWKQNKVNVSAIPSGRYKCRWVKSPKFGWVYTVTNVPDRLYIRIHSGNYPRDIQGCILLGLSQSRDAVWSSRIAINYLAAQLQRRPFDLEIITFWE